MSYHALACKFDSGAFLTSVQVLDEFQHAYVGLLSKKEKRPELAELFKNPESKLFTKEQKEAIWKLQEKRCNCCRNIYPLDNGDGDHHQATADGGKSTYENCCWYCSGCHRRKTTAENKFRRVRKHLVDLAAEVSSLNQKETPEFHEESPNRNKKPVPDKCNAISKPPAGFQNISSFFHVRETREDAHDSQHDEDDTPVLIANTQIETDAIQPALPNEAGVAKALPNTDTITISETSSKKRSLPENCTAENLLLYAISKRAKFSQNGAITHPKTKKPEAIKKSNGGTLRSLCCNWKDDDTYPLLLQKEDSKGNILDKSVKVTKKGVFIRLTAQGEKKASELDMDQEFVESFNVSADWAEWINA